MRTLVIQHAESSPPGLLQPWLERRGAEVEILRIDEKRPPDRDARDYSLIASLGSEFGAYEDDVEWIGQEMDLFRDALGANVPILGICFGGQLLARVLGSRVFRAHNEEIGWLPVRSSDLDLVPDALWFQWHLDTFTVPPGARVVAQSDIGPQAFIFGRSLGVQFHPEVTTEIVDDWVRVYRHELDEHGVDPNRLLVETHELAETAHSNTIRLLETFLERVVRPRARA